MTGGIVVHLIHPGGTADKYSMKDPMAIMHMDRQTATATAVPVRQYAVGGVRLFVAMMPDATEQDLAQAILRPDVYETAVKP